MYILLVINFFILYRFKSSFTHHDWPLSHLMESCPHTMFAAMRCDEAFIRKLQVSDAFLTPTQITPRPHTRQLRDGMLLKVILFF